MKQPFCSSNRKRWMTGGGMLVALLAFALSARAVDVPLVAVPSIGSATGASSVELADLDLDGDLDAVTTAATSGEVTWWENTVGNGTFWTAHAIDAALGGATSVQVADVDGDGLPDVVAAGRTDDDVVWWQNDGTPATGTWTRFSIDTSFGGARSVWVADLDRNGTLDVLAAGDSANQIVWWQNDGTPTDDVTDDGAGNYWTQRTVGGSVTGATAVVAADLDGDGFLDVVGAGNTGGGLGWWQNDGDPTDGGWTVRFVDSAFTDVRSARTADVDGDGDLDVVAASDGTGDMVAWWENDGDPTDNVDDGAGNYWPQHTVASLFDGGFSARAVDLDGDGDLDLLGTATTADDVAWWENDGTPTDNTTDLGGGNFWTLHTVDGAFNGARAAAAGDVDGDGDLDVAATAFADGLVSWWRNDSIHRSALFSTEATVAGAISPEALALADVDLDGDLDVVSGSQAGPSELDWWESDGTPADGGWTAHVIGNPFTVARTLAPGDLDGDGDPDLVAGLGVSGSDFSWWENDGTPETGTWTEHVLRAGTIGILDSELADLDRDGDLDVVFTEGFANLIAWFENDGSACSPTCAWPEHSIDAAFDSPRYLTVADVDGDGDLDVASHATSDQILVWWENDGSPANDTAWVEHGIDSGSGVICPTVAADLDGDGDLDVLGCPPAGNGMSWYENDGSPANDSSWTLRTEIMSQVPQDALALDFDGDGDLDVAGSIPLNASIEELFFAWWENTAGDGTTWSRHDILSPVDLWRIDAGDLDGDGRPDLAGTRIGDDTISWWPNGGGQFALATQDLSSAGLLSGTDDDVLAIEAAHRGRAGDSDVELVTFELLFEETAGDPLTTAEANALFDSLTIYLDDGSGALGGADTLVTTVSPLALTAGVQTVAFASGTDVQLDVGTPKTYLVVLTTASDAAAQTPNTFRVTHLTSSSSSARDVVADIPLELETVADVSTGQVTVTGGCFALTPSHTGNGTDPVPTPSQSTGCAAGEFVAGEVVSLAATPDSGWQVAGWSGTDDDPSTSTTNSLTMPGSAHAASVSYVFPDELIIDGEFLAGTQVREACVTIKAGDVPGVDPSGVATSIAASSTVTLRAGSTVVFYSGFRVFSNASLTVEVATPTACSP